MKFSNTYQAKKKRIANLPVLTNDMMEAKLKKDALGLVNEFQKGLRNKDLGLEALKPETVAGKEAKGYKKPMNPLYGKGDDQKDDSYINILRVRKLKNGWKVYPSTKMHWSGKIKLKDLFTVHEYGTKVVMKNGTIIQIPPRPAFLLAYRRWLSIRKKDKRETSTQVKQAITDYIMKADYGRFRTFIKKQKVDLKNPAVEG